MRINMKPVSVIEANLGIQENGPVHAFFTDSCDKYMDSYIPFSGNSGGIHLRENKEKGVNYIQYNMQYASYQYYGERADGSHKVQNYTTPGTGPYWDVAMWNVEKDNVVKEVQNYVDTHGGK